MRELISYKDFKAGRLVPIASGMVPLRKLTVRSLILVKPKVMYQQISELSQRINRRWDTQFQGTPSRSAFSQAVPQVHEVPAGKYVHNPVKSSEY